MLSLLLIKLQLGKEGKEERKSAWSGLCASLGTASGGSQKVPPPMFVCILHHSPAPEALIHSSPAKKNPKISC